MAFAENTYISQFDVQPDGSIRVRKTSEISKDGSVVATTYWRCVLSPNDPQANEVLDEPFYLNVAQHAWAQLAP